MAHLSREMDIKLSQKGMILYMYGQVFRALKKKECSFDKSRIPDTPNPYTNRKKLLVLAYICALKS